MLQDLSDCVAVGCCGGSEDGVLPVSQAEKALERLPQRNLVVLPGCGHAPQLDCPKAFLAALEQFLGDRQL